MTVTRNSRTILALAAGTLANAERDVTAEDASVLSELTIEDLKNGRLPKRTDQLLPEAATTPAER